MRGFPNNDAVNYRKVLTSVLNQYYDQYIKRLAWSGYTFPTTDYYLGAFGTSLPASFISYRREGDSLDPGAGYKWLVFVVLHEDVILYAARYVTRLGKDVVLFGEGGAGMHYKLEDGMFIAGVALRAERMDALVDDVRSL
jgi:hypothetical protein